MCIIERNYIGEYKCMTTYDVHLPDCRNCPSEVRRSLLQFDPQIQHRSEFYHYLLRLRSLLRDQSAQQR